MPAAVKLTMKVDDTVLRALLKKTPDLYKKKVSAALDEIGRQLHYDTVPLAPHETGALKRSIRYKVESYKRVILMAGDQGALKYCRWVHEGEVPGLPPRPYLEWGKKKAWRMVKVIMKQAINDIARSL